MKKTKYLTRTALLLALALLFQSLRLIPALAFISQPIIGSLVNLTIIVASGVVGFWSSVFIGICTPIVARLQGQLGQDLFIPVVALANVMYGAIFYYFQKIKLEKVKGILGVVVGSLAKFALLLFAMPFVFGTFIQSSLPEAQAAKMTASIATNFGGPIQLITALVGGALALIIIKALKGKITK